MRVERLDITVLFSQNVLFSLHASLTLVMRSLSIIFLSVPITCVRSHPCCVYASLLQPRYGNVTLSPENVNTLALPTVHYQTVIEDTHYDVVLMCVVSLLFLLKKDPHLFLKKEQCWFSFSPSPLIGSELF